MITQCSGITKYSKITSSLNCKYLSMEMSEFKNYECLNSEFGNSEIVNSELNFGLRLRVCQKEMSLLKTFFGFQFRIC